MIFSWKVFLARNLDNIIDIANNYIFHWKLEKIIEVTYSYREIEDWKYLNETLFEEYLWLSYPEYNLETLWLKYRFRVWIQMLQIESLIKKSKKMIVFSRQESYRRNLFIESLEYVYHVLELSILWVDFELEKAWIPFIYSKERQLNLIQKIEAKEAQIFWGKIKDYKNEFYECYNYVENKHISLKHLLDQNEKNQMRRYLREIARQNPWGPQKKKIKTPSIRLSWNFLDKEIYRKDYRKIFDKICEIYGLPQRTKLTNAWSIYDGDNHLEIPRNQSFLTLPLSRILKLISHEIESHFISAYNGRILIGKFRWAHNLPKEEWVAMFMEKIFVWYDLDSITPITEAFFSILWGECLQGDDFTEFMKITSEKYKLRRNYMTSILRAKRNYSLKLPWVQHKDVVYFRWLDITVEYLQNGWEFYKLFLWKISFHDLEDASIIYSKSKRKNDIIFPLFFSDIIYYYLDGRQNNDTFIFDAKKFAMHLKKKYWFIGIERCKIIARLSEKQKMIESLLHYIEKHLDLE